MSHGHVTKSPPGTPTRLRALTYLAPGIPLELFQIVTEHLGRALECEITLETEERVSGPMHGVADPFADGHADIGFLCSPSYLYLRSQPRPSVELVPAGFVFRDERGGGEAVYFSDLVVRADHAALRFSDLAGSVWGYNDDCSLSGYFAALQNLSEIGCAGPFFGQRVCTGSHDASIDAILRGAIDSAAIDSTVLARLGRESPELLEQLRIVDSWGPFPVQPIVVRSDLGAARAGAIADALLDLNWASCRDSRLHDLGLDRFVPIGDEAYAAERQALCALGQISSQDTGQ